MDLTAWQRICNRILGRVVKKRARADKELADNLVKGSMKMMPEVYLATAIMTTLAITLICWGFVSLAMNKDIYGDVADDAAMVYRDVTLLGYDLITAMKMSVDRAASVWLTEFFQGMVGTLTAGGQLKLFFLNRAEHYMRENRTRLQMFLESIALLAESYIVVAVAMPLFLIVMLVIMFWVSGSGAQMSEGMLYGIVLGFIPMIHISYAILVWTSSKEQDM